MWVACGVARKQGVTPACTETGNASPEVAAFVEGTSCWTVCLAVSAARASWSTH